MAPVSFLPPPQALSEDRYPEIRVMLTIGGIDPKPMYETIRRGVHAVVATPGRLKVGRGRLQRSTYLGQGQV